MGSEVFHFGEFTLDLRERTLRRGADAVHLAPKAFDVLVALLRHPARLVSKDELLARVWPDSFVEEGILTVHVSALRRTLGDEARPPRYIETVARSGYRFVSPVRRVEDPGDDAPLSPVMRPVELYECVGRGRSHLLSASYFDVPQAVAAFRAAIEIDGTYAPAHAGLARARCAEAELRTVPHLEAFAEARTLALRALGIDSACVEAHVARNSTVPSRLGLGSRRSEPAARACARSCSHGRIGAVRRVDGSAWKARRRPPVQATGARPQPTVAMAAGADRDLVLASAEAR